MEAGEYARLLKRRWPLLLILAALCGVGAWISLALAPTEFRKTLHFVLHPDPSFELTDVPSAINALGEDSPLTRSVVGALPSQHIFGSVVEAATDAEAGDFTLKVSLAP